MNTPFGWEGAFYTQANSPTAKRWAKPPSPRATSPGRRSRPHHYKTKLPKNQGERGKEAEERREGRREEGGVTSLQPCTRLADHRDDDSQALQPPTAPVAPSTVPYCSSHCHHASTLIRLAAPRPPVLQAFQRQRRPLPFNPVTHLAVPLSWNTAKTTKPTGPVHQVQELHQRRLADA